MLSNSLNRRLLACAGVTGDPQSRFKSLKGSHCNTKYNSLTKRHSLDSKPTTQMRKKLQLVDNAEDGHLGKQTAGAQKYSRLQDRNNRTRIYWCSKNKRSKSGEKSKTKVKRNWSELGKHKPSKADRKAAKPDANFRSMVEARNDTKPDLTGPSFDSYFSKYSPDNRLCLKKAQSLLNSTMLTKRESEEQRQFPCNMEELMNKLVGVLGKYQKRMAQLKDQREYYRAKWRQEKRKH